SDLRVYVKSRESYFYPDATIICGDIEYSDEEKDTVKNPSVIFEILSPSTKDYDKGTKLFYYMQISSLRQYIIIDSTSLVVRSGIKQADGAWRFQELDHFTDQLLIEPVSSYLHLKDVYEGIDFANPLQRVEK
ncbi:MAG: Uma2 family endonuclease, partial [Chitinophagaceae bacterium]